MTLRRKHIRRGAALAAIVIGLGGLPVSADEAADAETPRQAPLEQRSARRAPSVRIRTVVSGLDHAWDVAFTPGGQMLITERDRGRISVRGRDGVRRTLVARVPRLWVSGETGLMGILVDPRFRSNRRFYTCHGFTRLSGGHDVRVVAWRTNDKVRSARLVETLVSGIDTTSGRHGGCRLRLGGKGALFIGTGDAAITGSARDRSSLNGKVLRVNRMNGNAIRTNPFINSSNANTRKLWTFGHRNVQGLALRPGGKMWSVEHGSDRDDEVNLLRPGGDYGWAAGPGYNEASRPMTDYSLPGRQIDAEWESGVPTVAPSGATWLKGPRWGDWNGALAVAALKDRSVRIMQFGSGRLLGVERPGVFTSFGRLRAAQLGPGNVLYLTTDNGGGTDRVLAVTAQP